MSKLVDMIGRGLLASRPTAGIPGRVYFATDGDGTLYRDNGSTWDSIEGTGEGAAGALADLADVDLITSPPDDGDRLAWVSGDSKWKAVADSGGAEALAELTDVDLTTTPPTDGDVLTYDGDDWVPQAPTGGGGGTLDALSDVDLTVPPVDGQTIVWDAASGTFKAGWYITPAELLLLDAGTGVTKDGSDLVSQWADASYLENHAIQATATNQPLWVDNIINGEPVLRFDGTDNYMVADIPATLTGFTFATVVRPRANESTKGIFQWANVPASGGPFMLMQRNGANVRWIVHDNYRWDTAHADDVAKLYVLRWTGTIWSLWIDNTLQTEYTAGAGSNQASATMFYIGNGFNGYFNGDIAAVELYSRPLNSGQISALTTRLMTKYGL